MMSHQEISDRLELQDLLARYSHAVDTRDWEAFRAVFSVDAVIDYTVFGGPRGTVEEVVTFLAQAMPMFSTFQHMVGLPLLEIDGDRATGRTICHNPMEFNGRVFYCGLWYCDRFVRTAEGWRIAERVEERSYTFNMPPELQPPR